MWLASVRKVLGENHSGSPSSSDCTSCYHVAVSCTNSKHILCTSITILLLCQKFHCLFHRALLAVLIKWLNFTTNAGQRKYEAIHKSSDVVDLLNSLIKAQVAAGNKPITVMCKYVIHTFSSERIIVNYYSTVMVWAGQVPSSASTHSWRRLKWREWVTYSSSSRTLVCSARDWSGTRY